jgi:CheY-like chemotaxis protein
MTTQTRILIADDQENIRSGVRLILDAQPDMTVVAEASNGQAAVDLARHLRPDVVLADIRMPRLDGLEVTRRLCGPDRPDPIRVIVVTMFDLDEYVAEALRNGARAGTAGSWPSRRGPSAVVRDRDHEQERPPQQQRRVSRVGDPGAGGLVRRRACRIDRWRAPVEDGIEHGVRVTGEDQRRTRPGDGGGCPDADRSSSDDRYPRGEDLAPPAHQADGQQCRRE